ncbi:DUF1501 domain-containing protein [Heliobacterium gestii]|uniref:DUF1501 domain-containing protein n=1 Tax=Heliomicrobium gestii TaxID=2699 RepID=A0A845LIY0_HELGE|nr:DUF1501 domain-containing protein [Heliomicrobium gestii]MBM7868117.1 uncharacterized protein (DUF1501 family) [Heliomicrobium gestii]MZP44355.1 DUF1501 domain-containing protein [Heliomicrobium gestii]
MDSITRRQFLVGAGITTAVLGAGALSGCANGLFPAQLAFAGTGSAPRTDRTLVVIQMAGGNDGLNTLIPYQNDAYYNNRPTIAVKADAVLPLDEQVGLSPALAGIHRLYGAGRVAIAQGVGYPKPDRSHFRSMDIWNLADPDTRAQQGWLARYMASTPDANHPMRAVVIGNQMLLALSGELSVPVIPSLNNYKLAKETALVEAFKQMYATAASTDPYLSVKRKGNSLIASVEQVERLKGTSQGYPSTTLGRALADAAALIKGETQTQVIYTQLGGFDTHAGQVQTQTNQLKQVDEAVSHFCQDLDESGKADQVLLLLFSEFGRRVHENASGGTDHGTAGPVFFIGAPVKGGLYGEYPSLTDLDQGDLKFTTDFRRLYATVIDRFLGGSSETVLGGRFDPIDFM